MRPPGQGKWRQPGRGRRLRCQMKGTDAARGIIWYKTFHYSKPCRWCGQRARDCAEREIGRIEGIRFVGIDMGALPSQSARIAFEGARLAGVWFDEPPLRVKMTNGSEIVFSTPGDSDQWEGSGTFEPMM